MVSQINAMALGCKTYQTIECPAVEVFETQFGGKRTANGAFARAARPVYCNIVAMDVPNKGLI